MQKRYGALLFALATLFPIAANAAGPQAPCAASPAPAFAAPGAPPSVAIFHASDLAAWQPASCIGWSAASATRSKLVIAVAGSFQATASIERFIGKVATVSSLAAIKYWSTTDKEWRPLANAASALSGPDSKKRRADFTSSDLSTGAQLYYWEDDSRSGEVITRLTVRERTADSAIIATENVTPIRRFMITIFPPGALQTVLFIKRIAPDTWGVYLLSRTSDDTSMLAGGHEASYINRAVALYRQIAGIRTDQEPPAAR